MREIKFRAWSKDWDGAFYMSYSDKYEEDEIPTSQHMLMSYFFRNLNHEANLMQYTGLKDLSGKEIFEGDIVRWTSTFKGAESKEHVDTIQWQNSYACFMLMPHVHEPHAAMMEVIGNIYENPELLNTQRNTITL